MEAIEKEALHNARQVIKKQFTTISSLHEVSLLSSEYRETLVLTKLKLKRAIQTYDDEFSILREKIGTLFFLTSSFKQRFSNILTTHNNPRSRYKYSKLPEWLKLLKRLSYAQNNILTTLKRIDEFSLLPEKVEQLRNLMNVYCNENCVDKERLMLGYVASRTLELEKWRDNIILDILHLDQEHRQKQECIKEQIDRVGNRRSQHFHSAMRNFCSMRKSMYEYNHTQLIQFIGQYLDMILHLSKEFRCIIKTILSKCLTIGQENPDLLTQAADVTSSIVQSRITEDYLILEGKDGKSIGDDERLTFQQEIISLLQNVLDREIKTKCCDYIFQAADKGKSKFDATLEAASYGLADYIVFLKEISPCFPRCFCVDSMYHDIFHKYIIPQVQALYYQVAASKGEQELRICDISNLLSWIDHYEQSIAVGTRSNTTATSRARAMSFAKDIDILKRLCLNVIRNQMRDMFNAIRARDSEMIFDQDGYLSTDDPEDVFSVINMQLSVLNSYMPKQFFSSFVLICIEELKVMQEAIKADIDEGVKPNEIECLCSVVNDCSRLHDRCENFCDEQTKVTSENQGNKENEFQEKANELLVGYISLSLHVIEKITEIILSDLRNRHIMGKIFTADWEKEEPIVGTVINTLQDYFGDLKEWLPEYFFSKCVRGCFEKVVACYIDQLLYFQDMHKSLEFHDMLRVSQIMANDRMNLIAFFGERMLPHMIATGFKGMTQMEESLEFMNSVSRILGSASLDDVSASIIHLLNQFDSKITLKLIREILCKRKDFDDKDMSFLEQIMMKYEIHTNDSTCSSIKYLMIKDQIEDSNKKVTSIVKDKKKYSLIIQSPRINYSDMKEKTSRLSKQAKVLIKARTKTVLTLPKVNTSNIKNKMKKKLSNI